MDFDLTDEQREIRRTAHDLLAQRATPERVRAAAESREYDEALWREMSQLGWAGIAIAEEHGGQGLGMVELAVLLEQLGAAVAPSPLLGTAVAALVLEQAGSDAQRAEWLPRLATGEATAALAVAGAGKRQPRLLGGPTTSTEETMRGEAGAGGGEAALVADADRAAVIVLVRDGAARLVAREDARVQDVETIDPTRRYARVSAPDGAGEPLPGDLAAGLDRAAVAVAAELVGVCQRALDMTVAYVKERKQFDTPVGAFQAVAHRCAQMLLHTESARSATSFAAWAADADADALPEAAALAKAVASEAGREVTASAIQAHGGIGFTWEADVHWLYKRAQLNAILLGSTGVHRARLARLVAARRALAAA
jgi:alkylation response protein AidB-like acyl-CoA dehydrogenase